MSMLTAGIVVRSGDDQPPEVIHLTKTPKQSKRGQGNSASSREHPDAPDWLARLSDGPVGQFLRRVFAALLAIKQSFDNDCTFSIQQGPIDEFAHNEEGPGGVKRYLVYEYGLERIPDGQEGADFACVDREKTVRVAKWFTPAIKCGLFGAYNLREWNCEHFATFCKTFQLDVDDLEDSTLPVEHAGNNNRQTTIQKAFILKNSKATSFQTLKGGAIFSRLPLVGTTRHLRRKSHAKRRPPTSTAFGTPDPFHSTQYVDRMPALHRSPSGSIMADLQDSQWYMTSRTDHGPTATSNSPHCDRPGEAWDADELDGGDSSALLRSSTSEKKKNGQQYLPFEETSHKVIPLRSFSLPVSFG